MSIKTTHALYGDNGPLEVAVLHEHAIFILHELVVVAVVCLHFGHTVFTDERHPYVTDFEIED